MNDISELFARDPLSLSSQDISTIVEEMRKARHSFNAGNMKAGSTKPKTAAQKQLGDLTSKLNISL